MTQRNNSTPILATKLFIPQARPNVVQRARLVTRLQQGLQRKLTLLSAPAGFGKTTLVSQWLATCQQPFAWLSLDEGDREPTRFLTYFVAACQTIAPQLGEGLLALLHSPQPPPIESILTTLLNEVTRLRHPILLVLDDYHLLESPAIDHALTFLLEHLPPTLHLVITTREDPALPLARYRARGYLTELRAADLRFTPAEAADFLNQVMGLTLSAQEIAALESRTEGWIAGLQLAALSMQGHDDVAGFIRAFAGDHRYIVDYLVDEVLQRQPAALRTFLLQSAILEQLSGPLCDAVTGPLEDNVVGSARLEALERGNFFVVPLDDKRHWYRYHHLFADVLTAQLLAEQPQHVATLHRRASAWYAQNSFPAHAIRHALAARDFEQAAKLIELAVPDLRRNRAGVTLFGWLRQLPDAMIRDRPVLSVAYAWGLLAVGELGGVETRLRDAERWLQCAPEGQDDPSGSMVVHDQEEFRHLATAIAAYRAILAQIRGDLPAATQYARQTLDLADEEDHLRRGAAAAILGLASWWNGDLENAYRSYADGMVSLQRAGNISDALNGTLTRADIRIAQGRLREAFNIYDQALQSSQKQGDPPMQGIADLYVGMSELHYEHNDLDAATQHLLRSQELGERTGMAENRYRWCLAMARIRQARGDLDGALDLLNEAERLYVSDFFPNVRPVAALKARLRLAQGRVEEATTWAHEQGFSLEAESAGDLHYLREFDHITLIRVLLARAHSGPTDRSLPEAMALLNRLLHAAQTGDRKGSMIEILLLQARTHQLQDDIQAALVPLQQALMLAEPEGYVRLFVDEGPTLEQLLLAIAASNQQACNMNVYANKLLAAFATAQPSTTDPSPLPTYQKATPSRPLIEPLIEPLSQRELEVLRLFKSDLSGPQIAQELMVALSTIRTHTKSIYSKLNVNSRRAAVKRAEELKLI